MHALIIPKPLARTALSLIAGGVFLCSGPIAHAQPLFPPNEIVGVGVEGLDASDPISARQNSHSWSMVWWNGRLYVGTGRSTFCVQQATLEFFHPDKNYYPPKDKDVVCPTDPHDLDLTAEIWRWTPDPVATTGLPGTWDRVYPPGPGRPPAGTYPNDVPIQGTSPQKYTARDIGYRGMAIFKEASGTEALYVSGDSTRGGAGTGFDGPVPPPRILRSTDGVNFDPVPFNPDEVLGSSLISGYRSLKTYKGKLYVVGSIGQLGHGVLLEATNPELGAFRQVSGLRADGKPLTFFEIETYNGFLWAGTGVQPQNDDTPFSVLKTDATGEPPYTFTTVIPPGAYKTKKPSAAVISMQVFASCPLQPCPSPLQRLYVGTDREVLRVNPDDSWELVVGSPRKTPTGQPLLPLSGFDYGYDNFFNIHMWRMGVYPTAPGSTPWFYVGTHDQSTKWRNLKGNIGTMLKPGMGFDLFSTPDGWHYSLVTRNGFGDMFNNGMRNFAVTPYGFFMGTADHFFGTNVYLGTNVPNPAACVPGKNNCQPLRLEVEAKGKVALLSWEGSPLATRFHVFRSAGFGALAEIGTADPLNPLPPTGGGVYLDQAIKPFGTYHYYVVAEDALARMTEPSNMVHVPFRGPVPTFKSLEAVLTGWSAPAALTDPLAAAKTAVEAADWTTALAQLQAMGTLIASPTQTLLLPYRAQDLGILLSKFNRRVLLAQGGALPPKALMK
jgi:hypothetical protein